APAGRGRRDIRPRRSPGHAATLTPRNPDRKGQLAMKYPIDPFMPAVELAAAIRRKEVSPAEVAAARDASGNLFRREGEYWTVRYEGSVTRLKDGKGLRYLAQLLSDPGREYHAVDLAAADSQPARSAPPAGLARRRIAGASRSRGRRRDAGRPGQGRLPGTARRAGGRAGGGRALQ